MISSDRDERLWLAVSPVWHDDSSSAEYFDQTRDAMSNGEVKVTGGLDQTTKSVIVLFLDSAVFRHAENGPARSTSGKVKSTSDCWQRRVIAR